jgi:hypothetical protein
LAKTGDRAPDGLRTLAGFQPYPAASDGSTQVSPGLGNGAGQQPSAYVEAEDVMLHDGGEASGICGVETAGRVKGQGVLGVLGEQPVGDGEVEVGTEG